MRLRFPLEAPLCSTPGHARPRRLERGAEGGLDFHYYDNKEQAGGIIKAAQVRAGGGTSQAWPGLAWPGLA